MKIRFLLKKKGNGKKEGLVFVGLYFKDTTEIISTGQRIQVKDWNPKDQFPRDHTGSVAKAINRVRDQVNKAITRLEAREELPTPFAVKQEYNLNAKKILSDKTVQDKKAKLGKRSVVGLANQWMENNLFRFKDSSKKSIKESINQFIDFLEKSGTRKLEVDELNPELITAYECFLQEKKKLANNTHGKRMKHLRWFLKTLKYDVTAIKIRSNRKEIIALTLEEIQKLEKVDVSGSSEKQKAKDLFLLGCYTGLRISDLKRIDETRIIDGRIRMTLQKNEKEVTIPIIPEANEILKRYNNRSPKLSEQVLNRSIKEVCEKAGITKVLSVRKNVAGKDVDKQIPKYKLITSHTAGKTFISLASLWFDLTPTEIAAIVGKDPKTLLNHYLNLPRESAIKKMEGYGGERKV